MSEQLVIRLGELATSPISWLVRGLNNGELISSGVLPTAAELSSLGERAGGRKVVVLVPGTQVTLHEVELPPGNPKVALRALPYQLEESLAEDVEQFQLVPLERNGSMQRVLVVRHSQLRGWLSWLADAGIEPELMVPDTLALPAGSALAIDDLWLIRPVAGAALAIENELLPAVVPAILETMGEQQWRLWQPWPLAEMAELTLIAEPEELPLWVLANNLPARSANLLCGSYAPKKEWSGPLLQYGRVLIAALVVFALALTFKGLSWWRDGQTIATLKAHSQQVYQTAFPNEQPPRPEQLRSVMQSRAAAVGGSGGGADFLTMLRTVAPAFKAVKGLEPQTMRFDRHLGEVRVQAEGGSFGDFEQFRQQLGGGLSVEIGSQNNQGDKVVGAITIRGQQ